MFDLFNPYAPSPVNDDEDLYTLAQYAGYIPGGQAVDYPTPEPASSPAPDPDYAELGPITSPSSVSAGITQPVTPGITPGQPSPSSFGFGYSRRGYSGSPEAQAHRRGDKLDQEYAQIGAQVQEGIQPQLEVARAGAQGRADAALAEGKALADKVTAQGEQALVMQRLQDDFAAEEAKINAEASAMANQAKVDYITALADFRAAKVDPSQLWQNLTGGERFGMLATAFVHDFLGARGINTSAMATFNKAIDRNIDAQIQAIKTKGEVAEGFKSLWWMQRNQSASDAEARTRVRGFMLEAAKQQIAANMAQYDAALATAQGQSAMAEINAELSKTYIEIYRHADANAIALRNQALEKWKARLNSYMEQQALNLRKKELEQARLKQEQAQPLHPIYDPESGEARWVFNPNLNLSDTEYKEVRERFAASDEANLLMQELREAQRTAKEVPDIWRGTRFSDTDQQRFHSLSLRLAHAALKANGERATDKDVEQYMKGFGVHTVLNRADLEKLIAHTQSDMLRASESLVRTYAIDLPQEMRGQYGTSARMAPFASSKADADATRRPPSKALEEIHLEKASETAAGVPGREKLDPGTTNAATKKAQAELYKQRPDLYEQPVYDGDGDPTNAPAFEKSHMELRHLAAKARRAGVPDDNNKALKRLKDVAGPYINAGISDDPEAYSAAYALYTLDEEE